MDMDERTKQAETKVFKAVFPGSTNHYDTLYGGEAMSMMDEVAFITATRFSRKKVVTVSSDRIDFTEPIPSGTIIELVGNVVHVGNTSMKVKVEVFTEDMFSLTPNRKQAISGTFTFVAIDDNKQPLKIL